MQLKNQEGITKNIIMYVIMFFWNIGVNQGVPGDIRVPGAIRVLRTLTPLHPYPHSVLQIYMTA
jgi:hypothetical protein